MTEDLSQITFDAKGADAGRLSRAFHDWQRVGPAPRAPRPDRPARDVHAAPRPRSRAPAAAAAT